MQFSGLGKRARKSEVPKEVVDKVLGYQRNEVESFFLGLDKAVDKRTQKAYIHFLASLLGPDHAQVVLEYATSRFPDFK